MVCAGRHPSRRALSEAVSPVDVEARPSWVRLSPWVVLFSIPTLVLLVLLFRLPTELVGIDRALTYLVIAASAAPIILGPFVYRARTRLTHRDGSIEFHTWTGRVRRAAVAEGDRLQVSGGHRSAQIIDASGSTKLAFSCSAWRSAELAEWCQASGLGFEEI